MTAYKGIVQSETWNELLRNAKEIGANAVLNTRFGEALDKLDRRANETERSFGTARQN